MFPAPLLVGPQADVLPAVSVASKRTRVVPTVEMVALAPSVGLDQVVPPSVDVSQSKWSTPDPPESLELALIVTDGTFCGLSDPPVTVGVVGGVLSMRTFELDHGESFPKVSYARNRTIVLPLLVTVSVLPGLAADHVAPPSVDSSYW